MTNLKFSLAVPGLLVLTMALSGPAIAGSDEEQLARMADPDQWPAPGRDFALTRHSDLADFNTKNIGKLQMIWLQGTNALRGHEGQPLVIKDVGGKTMLFMISGCPAMVNCNVVQALDLTDPDNPKQVWSYVKKTDRDEIGCAARLLRHGQSWRFLCRRQIPLWHSRWLYHCPRWPERQGGLGGQEGLSREGRDHHGGSVDRRRQGPQKPRLHSASPRPSEGRF